MKKGLNAMAAMEKRRAQWNDYQKQFQRRFILLSLRPLMFLRVHGVDAFDFQAVGPA